MTTSLLLLNVLQNEAYFQQKNWILMYVHWLAFDIHYFHKHAQHFSMDSNQVE